MRIGELETSLHLYQPPLYSAGAEGKWYESFEDALVHCQGRLTWDLASILSIVSFGYACGDRTLVNEVKRRPWLSEIGQDGKPHLKSIPAHGRIWTDYKEIATNFIRLLSDEVVRACQGREQIYVLLSGGLDSRVVAAILAKVYEQGLLNTKPKGLTWGLKNSRDVVYGSEVAKILGFDWHHIDLSAEDLMGNIDEIVKIGSLVSPIHLHRMSWFRNVSKDTLVVAGSYGDMVGRAEFSGRHLLELDYLKPVNRFGLINPKVCAIAVEDLQHDLKALHDRTPEEPKYILCEHEMHGHYTRSMLGQTMSFINHYCRVYQMFTHPAVYTYVWSFHPALRFDDLYAGALEKLNPKLLMLPWARTNRALKGKTTGANHSLAKGFHDYGRWIQGPLYGELRKYIDEDWFAATGVFDVDNIRSLADLVRDGKGGKGLYGLTPYEKWIWLAGFRRFSEWAEQLGKRIELDAEFREAKGDVCQLLSNSKPGLTQQMLSKSIFVYDILRWLQKMWRKIKRVKLRRKAIKEYPPLISQ